MSSESDSETDSEDCSGTVSVIETGNSDPDLDSVLECSDLRPDPDPGHSGFALGPDSDHYCGSGQID